MKNIYRCAICELIRKSKGKYVYWDETKSQKIMICGKCDLKMKRMKIKYVLTANFYFGAI